MDVLARMERHRFEQVLFCHDPDSGLKAVIAIHNTKLGPALGGCRMWQYADEDAAVADAMRLARGMTYKAAVSGLPYGGGKAVILGDPDTAKSEALFRSLGRFIHGLQGRYITGMDLGTTVQDMDFIKLETGHVTDTSGTLGAAGNFTAGMTAYGVYLGIRAAVKQAFGTDSLKNKKITVQGLGKVGFFLCRYLYESHARLAVSDIRGDLVNRAVEAFGAEPVSPEEIYKVPCDVFAPCALGGILNDRTLPLLRCTVVAGAANNQLAEDRHGDMLHEAGILYAPDYVINAGGLIITAAELEGHGAAEAKRRVVSVSDTLAKVFRLSSKQGISTAVAADRIAEEALNRG